jgi:sarcosine oxidase subunit beta
MTPDHRPLLGWAPEVANLFLACGCSGHGVMHSPALGQLAAEMLLRRASSLDASALRPGRFHEGAPEPISPLL